MEHANFRAWFTANLADSAEDIASHGADAGYAYITYNKDGAELFDLYADEIIETMNDEAESMGLANWCALAATFGRADMLEAGIDASKTLFVWFMCELVAREMSEA